MAGIEERVCRLEGSLRLWKRLVVCLVLTMCGIVLAGWKPTPGVVQSTKFVLVDSKGQSRGELGLDAKGNTLFELLGTGGKVAISARVLKTGAAGSLNLLVGSTGPSAVWSNGDDLVSVMPVSVSLMNPKGDTSTTLLSSQITVRGPNGPIWATPR